MNPLSRTFAALASALGFYGGDAIHLAKLKPGSATARDVRERLGAPAAEWQKDDRSVTWEYPRGPEGTRCWMLTLDARGVLQKIEQALTEENFARIEKGWSAQQVRRLLGKPATEVEFPLKPEVVWDWRIDSAMPGNRAWFQVHFGLNGFVTGTSRREESAAG
ncbi:MAG: hypothetical protein FIA96_08695 [Betaproteobacteria bacterium]|nr:hypothetical protein [Betaproteobacteria bacterium]